MLYGWALLFPSTLPILYQKAVWCSGEHLGSGARPLLTAFLIVFENFFLQLYMFLRFSVCINIFYVLICMS